MEKERITIREGVLEVPDHPVIPFIEGDGTGPDIWAATVRVLDAAVDKAYGGSRKIAWKEVIKATIKKWLGEERKAGTTGTYTHHHQRHQEIIQESDFKDMTIVNMNTVRTWSIDRIIGYVYSTSYVSIPVLGDKKEPFEADLRKRLAGLDPGGGFKERVTTEIIMAWKR